MATLAIATQQARSKVPWLFRTFIRRSGTLVKTVNKGDIVIIKINRPEKGNAVNEATSRELSEAFRKFEVDANSSVAVLCGEGDTFCAGYDLEELSRADSEEFRKSIPPVGEGDGPMGPSRMKLSKPVIGAVQGHAVAGGLELALICDLRVMEEDAIMGVFNRRFGVPLLDGGTVRLPYIVGMSRALDLILTGRPVDAQEAHGMGLANRVVPQGQAVNEAIKLAEGIASFPANSLLADRKSVFYAAFNAESFYDALSYEYRKGVNISTIKESITGAHRFSKGEGRKGSFDN